VATAITYRTGEQATALRTVILDDVRCSVVILPTRRIDVLLGKLLCGTSCACSFWNHVQDSDGSDFLIPSSSVVQRRDIQVAAVVKRHNQTPAPPR
jgi:hypothetical protein